jgi:hypothetical protein
MERGAAARRLISEGEDPFQMLAAVVWPGRDWSDDVLRARLVACSSCAGDTRCETCCNTGLVVAA